MNGVCSGPLCDTCHNGGGVEIRRFCLGVLVSEELSSTSMGLIEGELISNEVGDKRHGRVKCLVS